MTVTSNDTGDLAAPTTFAVVLTAPDGRDGIERARAKLRDIADHVRDTGHIVELTRHGRTVAVIGPAEAVRPVQGVEVTRTNEFQPVAARIAARGEPATRIRPSNEPPAPTEI